MLRLLFITALIFSTVLIAQEDQRGPVNLLKCDNQHSYLDIRYIPKSNLLDITFGDEDLNEENYNKALTEEELGMVKDGTWSIAFRDLRTSKFVAVNVSHNTSAIFFSGQSSQGMGCYKVDEID